MWWNDMTDSTSIPLDLMPLPWHTLDLNTICYNKQQVILWQWNVYGDGDDEKSEASYLIPRVGELVPRLQFIFFYKFLNSCQAKPSHKVTLVNFLCVHINVFFLRHKIQNNNFYVHCGKKWFVNQRKMGLLNDKSFKQALERFHSEIFYCQTRRRHYSLNQWVLVSFSFTSNKIVHNFWVGAQKYVLMCVVTLSTRTHHGAIYVEKPTNE